MKSADQAGKWMLQVLLNRHSMLAWPHFQEITLSARDQTRNRRRHFRWRAIAVEQRASDRQISATVSRICWRRFSRHRLDYFRTACGWCAPPGPEFGVILK
jgi:hypothetical protein